MSQQLPSPQLLNQVVNFIKNQKNQDYFCLFLLGSQSGLRVSEAVNFNLSLKKKPNLYLIKGKRHKKRAVYISPSVIKELKKNNWQSQQTNRFSFAHFLQKVKKDLNISPNIELTPHTLRRCFATYQAISGMPLPVLQKLLGHASIRTTALYWKNAATPQEKEYISQWLEGKAPQKPKSNDKKEQLWVFINIQQTINIFILQEENSNHKLLAVEKEKNKFLTQELANHKQIITNLQNELKKAFSNKELAKQQLINEQTKNQQLELLLKAEKAKNQALIKQNSEKLIAQIEIPAKK